MSNQVHILYSKMSEGYEQQYYDYQCLIFFHRQDALRFGGVFFWLKKNLRGRKCLGGKQGYLCWDILF